MFYLIIFIYVLTHIFWLVQKEDNSINQIFCTYKDFYDDIYCRSKISAIIYYILYWVFVPFYAIIALILRYKKR